MMELQRLLWEIDSKINFIKNQFSKHDFPNYLVMLNAFEDFVKNDFTRNLKIILDKNLDGLSNGLHKLEQRKK